MPLIGNIFHYNFNSLRFLLLESSLEIFSNEKSYRLDNFLRQVNHFYSFNFIWLNVKNSLSFWIFKKTIFLDFFTFFSPSSLIFKGLFDVQISFILINSLPFFINYKSKFIHLFWLIFLFETFLLCHEIKHECEKLFFWF